MLNKAVAWGIALSSPMGGIKPLPETAKRLRFLDYEEMDRLLHAADANGYCLIAFMWHTGARRGEVKRLRWMDVDFKRDLLHIVNSKGGKSRDIPLSETAKDALRRLPGRLGAQRVFVFDIRRAFDRAIKRAGIKDCTPHTLRHTFASHLVMSGVDLVTVKELMGHSDIKMTLRYAHLSPDHKVAAVKRLDTYMDTSSQKALEMSV